YLAVAACLGVEPGQAIAVEDSPHGVRAAKSAGLYCIAVPNPMTADLDFSGADLRLDTLAELPLPHLLARLRPSPAGCRRSPNLWRCGVGVSAAAATRPE